MTAATKKKPPSLGSTIDQYWQLREEKRAAEAKVKEIEGRISDAEAKLLEQMDKDGVAKATGSKATASISATTSFSMEDFDVFTKYVKRTGYFHLFQRRVSDTAAREIFESKGAVPGLSPFIRRKINLLTVKG